MFCKKNNQPDKYVFFFKLAGFSMENEATSSTLKIKGFASATLVYISNVFCLGASQNR